MLDCPIGFNNAQTDTTCGPGINQRCCPGGCSCSGWVNGACGGACGVGRRQVTRSCNPGGCAATSSCITDPACNLPPPPGVPTNTPGPPPPPPPPPPGLPLTLRARAKEVSTYLASCTDVANSTAYLPNTTFSLNPAVAPGIQTQSGSAYVSWTTRTPGTYRLDVSAPLSYAISMACWNTTPPTFNSTGLFMPITNGQTGTWDVGLVFGIPWAQVEGGDVLVFGDIASRVPPTATPRFFNIAPTNGSPGIVTYHGNYDFDPEPFQNGASFVSAPKWLADDTNYDLYTTDWYQFFFNRFDMTAQTPDYNPAVIPLNKPTSRVDANGDVIPYYVQGNMTTGSNWTIGSGEKIIFFVTGDLRINGRINITGNGFIAFIVRGNIFVDPSVGVPPNSTNSVVEGVYITSPTGTFHTGASTTNNAERFVGKGTFIAGSFAMERNVNANGKAQNPFYSAELFAYDPQMLVTMPKRMMNLPIKWQEVAP